jgi:hypothetical protein
MSPDDTDKMDTIPALPPSHMEVPVGSAVRLLRPLLYELDDSGIFAFSLDCESLDED